LAAEIDPTVITRDNASPPWLQDTDGHVLLPAIARISTKE